MKEVLVEYIGRRRGKFKMRMEGYPIREWSIAPRAGNKERWLAVSEAELWDQQRDWMITRTRVTPDTVAPVSVKLAEPAPPAKRISTLLEEQVQQVVAEIAQEAQFCISDNGVVHKEDCRAWPKHPLKTFDSFADAVNDEDFDRAHKLCCKGELVMQRGKAELEDVLTEVEGGLTQMNVLGESYGVQATEV